MIKEVLSRVEITYQTFRDVCYEWEEVVSKYFGVPIRQVFVASKPPQKKGVVKSLKKVAKNALLSIPALRRVIWDSRNPALMQNITSPLSIYFAMNHRELSVCIGNNCIPILLDVFTDWELSEVIRRIGKLKLFYVTSRDVYNRIRIRDPYSNVRYMPQSIADKYHSENFAEYRNKYIDVCMPGRGNPVLHEYMLRYARENKNIKYVYKRNFGNREYASTDGNILLQATDRESYMNLLASSKVSIVGCSGIDNAREDTNGVCFVTPRFYESAVVGCSLIGRYPDNQEFRELNMSRYCPNITSYDQFVRELERALAIAPEELYAQNRDFILNSLTSKRAEQIQKDLEELTCQNS